MTDNGYEKKGNMIAFTKERITSTFTVHWQLPLSTARGIREQIDSEQTPRT